MPIKELTIIFLNEKQNQLMEWCKRMEDAQGEYSRQPELYHLFQKEMDKADEYADRIRRKIFELEESD